MNPALASIPVPPPAQEPRTTRPNILTVQGCSGCDRPACIRVKTPVGIRKVRTRLKMTLIPNVFTTIQAHPRRAPVARKYSVFAKLCKSCRKTALTTTLTVTDLNWLGPTPFSADAVGKVLPAVPVLVT